MIGLLAQRAFLGRFSEDVESFAIDRGFDLVAVGRLVAFPVDAHPMDRLGFAQIELDPLRKAPAACAPTGGSIGVDGEFDKVVLIFLL